MARSRPLVVLGHSVRLVLFLILSASAIDFLVDTLDSRGWSPGALFGLLLVAGAVSLVWRASLDLRKAVRRARA